jgi:hypothetical protein
MACFSLTLTNQEPLEPKRELRITKRRGNVHLHELEEP